LERQGDDVECPWCKREVHFIGPAAKLQNGNIDSFANPVTHEYGSVDRGYRRQVEIRVGRCPSPDCNRVSIALSALGGAGDDDGSWVFPQYSRVAPTEVRDSDPPLARDFEEASAVHQISPKASAALSRRCLQRILHEKGKANQRDLAEQIKHVLPSLPSPLGESVDHIRAVGNFAAHPLKATASGQILDVETGEAEWSLDVLEMLFDYYYVLPAKTQAKRLAMDQKLHSASKPPLMSPPKKP
jgi:hypothetical protein